MHPFAALLHLAVIVPLVVYIPLRETTSSHIRPANFHPRGTSGIPRRVRQVRNLARHLSALAPHAQPERKEAAGSKEMYDKLLSTFESTDPELWSDMISTSKHWSKVADGVFLRLTERIAFEQDLDKQDQLRNVWRKLMATHHDYVTDSNAMKQERISEYEATYDPRSMSYAEIKAQVDGTPDLDERERILREYKDLKRPEIIRRTEEGFSETMEFPESVPAGDLPKDPFPLFRVDTLQKQKSLDKYINGILEKEKREWNEVLEGDDRLLDDHEYQQMVLEQINRRINIINDDEAASTRRLKDLRHRIRTISYMSTRPHVVFDNDGIEDYDPKEGALMGSERQTSRVIDSLTRLTMDQLRLRLESREVPINPSRIEELCEAIHVVVDKQGKVNVFDFIAAIRERAQFAQVEETKYDSVKDFMENVETMGHISTVELHKALNMGGVDVTVEELVIHIRSSGLDFDHNGRFKLLDFTKVWDDLIGQKSEGDTSEARIDEAIEVLRKLSLDELFDTLAEDVSWANVQDKLRARVSGAIAAASSDDEKKDLRKFLDRVQYAQSRLGKFRDVLKRLEDSDPMLRESLVALYFPLMDSNFFKFVDRRIGEEQRWSSEEEVKDLSILAAQVRALVSTFNSLIEDKVELGLSQDSLQSLLSTNSLQEATQAIDNMSRNGTLSPTVVMLLGRARASVCESDGDSPLSKLTEYLHIAAKTALDNMLPAAVQNIRMLLDMDDPKVRRMRLLALVKNNTIEADKLLNLCGRLIQEYNAKSEGSIALIPEEIHQLKVLQREVYTYCLKETREEDLDLETENLEMVPEYPADTKWETEQKARKVKEFLPQVDPNRPQFIPMSPEDMARIDSDQSKDFSPPGTGADGKRPKRKTKQ
ncbi:hypothetical protein AAMO2058_000182800 [Amorphochlora amoebiformis]